MALKWNCLEPLTAIGIGMGACAMAPLDAGLTAGAVIGGASLFSRLRQNSRKAGLDDEKLVARVQKKLLGELKHWDQAEERAAAEHADAAMQTLLPQVMLRRDRLAATVTQARERNERYPVLAARLVVDELARHDAMFEQPRAGAPERYERAFALEAVEAALRSGMDDPDYATLLTLDIAIELGAAIRETIDAIQSLHDKVERGFDALQEELAQIKAQGRGDDAKLARLSEKAMRGAIARFVTFSPRADTEDIVQAVEEFAEDYERLRERVRKLDAHDNRVRGLQQAAEQALEADGDIEEARRLLREATQLRREAALAPVKDAAETQAALAEADLAALEWESAAVNWQAAAAMLAPFDAEAAGDLGNTAGIALFEFGRKHPGGALDAAVAAFRQSLGVYTRDDLPADWAMAQNNLGNALATQGERLGGQTGIDLLGEAVAAYRQALEVRTRDDRPVRWATTQNNLGNALQTQGERLGGQAGTDLLGEAVAAYRQALEVRTRDNLPFEWSATQNNLGIALKNQGERLGGQEGIDLLGEAVAAFRQALEVYARDDLPVDWAMTQNNLGTALKNQGVRLGGQEGIDLLGEAVAAYWKALEVYTRDDLPVAWALTKGNMGVAFESMADLTEDRRCRWLGDARTEMLASLEVLTADALSQYYSMATGILSRIEAKIAEHCSDK
ncbi:MAG: tetratricopeptide repeat protein [Erythrobacter sp.]|nr:tetratricopeptide repeat protein [Erythrobacter sp.]